MRGSRRIDAIVRSPGLCPAHISGKLPRECRQVHVVTRRAPEYLRIRHPSQSLVALRAVCGHTDKIRPLPPQNIAPQLVDHLVAGFELCREGRVRVDDFRLHRVQARRRCRARDLGIPEAVETEGCLKLDPVPNLAVNTIGGFGGFGERRHKSVCSLCGTKIVGIDCAIWVEYLRKANTDSKTIVESMQLHFF